MNKQEQAVVRNYIRRNSWVHTDGTRYFKTTENHSETDNIDFVVRSDWAEEYIESFSMQVLLENISNRDLVLGNIIPSSNTMYYLTEPQCNFLIKLKIDTWEQQTNNFLYRILKLGFYDNKDKPILQGMRKAYVKNKTRYS